MQHCREGRGRHCWPPSIMQITGVSTLLSLYLLSTVMSPSLQLTVSLGRHTGEGTQHCPAGPLTSLHCSTQLALLTAGNVNTLYYDDDTPGTSVPTRKVQRGGYIYKVLASCQISAALVNGCIVKLSSPGCKKCRRTRGCAAAAECGDQWPVVLEKVPSEGS